MAAYGRVQEFDGTFELTYETAVIGVCYAYLALKVQYYFRMLPQVLISSKKTSSKRRHINMFAISVKSINLFQSLMILQQRGCDRSALQSRKVPNRILMLQYQ